MVISIMNLKGGVGKSTISQNIAVWLAHQGYKVCICDTDNEQKSSMKWSGQREEDLPSIPVFGVTDADSKEVFTEEQGKAFAKNVKALKNDYDHIILDGTPILSELASWMVLISDIILCPTDPSPVSIWSLQNVKKRLDQVRALGVEREAYILLNKYSPNRNMDKEIEETLDQFNMPVLTSRLAERVAYKEAVLEGMGVIEYSDKKAAQEIQELMEEVMELQQLPKQVA